MSVGNAVPAEPERRRLEGGLRLQGGHALRDPDRPLVSIVTVVLNGADHLAEAMGSVFAQDYPNLEYIVIDGGSTDGSLELIRQSESRIDRWISERDRGIYDAMNKGIQLAEGAIIGLLNADDILYPGVVTRVVAAMGDQPQRKYTCGTVDLIDESGNVYGSSTPLNASLRAKRRFLEMPCPHLSVFVGRELYRELGLFDADFRLSADYDFLLRLMDHQVDCCELPFTVGAFRAGGQSGGMSTWRETKRVLEKHGVNWSRSQSIFLRSVLRTSLYRALPGWLINKVKRFTISKNRYHAEH